MYIHEIKIYIKFIYYHYPGKFEMKWLMQIGWGREKTRSWFFSNPTYYIGVEKKQDLDFSLTLQIGDSQHNLLLLQIILGHEYSEPRITQLRVQFTQVLRAFQVQAMSRYFGLLIGNGVVYFPMSCTFHNKWVLGDCII